MGYGTNGLGVLDGTMPLKQASGLLAGGTERIIMEEFDLSLSSVDKVAGTFNVVADIPKGFKVLTIDVVSTVSLTTTQLAFGIAGATTKYGAAKVYGTTVDAIVSWAKATGLAGVTPNQATERLIMTASAADLPGAGKVYVLVHCIAIG